MEIDVLKCHGSGNDFLLIDEITNPYSFTEQERAELARLLCNRGSHLGADGILFVMDSSHADGKMRIFNADGSEASMCGNGLRLVARYICEMKQKNEAIIETMKADLMVSKQKEIFADIATYQVEISPVSFALTDLPLQLPQESLRNETIPGLSDEVAFTALAVPNPHIVAIVEKEQLDSNLQKDLSEAVNGPNSWFPDGVNVSFVNWLKPGHIYVRTFERGVGFTNACGTAMSASSLVTCENNLNEFEKPINVYNNGGKVQCIVHQNDGKYWIDLIGNATYVFQAVVQVDLAKQSFDVSNQTMFSEQQAYEKLQAEVQAFLNSERKG